MFFFFSFFLFNLLSDTLAAGGWKSCGSDGVLLNQNCICLGSVPVFLCKPGSSLDKLYPVIWEQQCLLCVSGELELFSVRKDSQSAILSLLFTPCKAPEKCPHMQCGKPGLESQDEV